MNKLNYDNFAALQNAFDQGAKFKVVTRHGSRKVTDIILIEQKADGPRFRVLTADGNSPGWTGFRLDGTNRLSPSATLQRDEFVEPPAYYPQGLAARKVPENFKPEAVKPFLQRVLLGEKFHCPETRENLVAVTFRTGDLAVTLQPAEGTILDRRDSANYDHEGRHKWVPGRSLVPGVCPPKPKPAPHPVAVYLFESLERPGTYRAAVMGQSRLMNHDVWKQVGYAAVTPKE